MKRIISIWLAAFLAVASCMSVLAEEMEGTVSAELGVAPMNPLYEAWLQLDESEREGTIPPPTYEIPLSGNQAIMAMGVLPATYDLREQNAVPAVRNQLNSGSCWAFSGLASLESNLMLQHGSTYQFSPRHLEYSQVYQMKDGVNAEAFNRLANSGGSPEMLEAYLYRGVGPVEESVMPFTDGVDSLYLSDIDLATSDVRLMDFQYLPYDKNSQSQDDIITEIKTALMDCGMVDINIKFDYAQYNASTYALYVGSTTTVNHAAGIVGWDDNFSRTNFTTDPGMDGAWIVQNSWGTDWGNNGYFYISYAQDIVMPAVVKRAQEGKNYDNIYYYDPLGFSQFMGFNEEVYRGQAYAANIFDTQPGDQELTEVTIATAAFTSYQIYINPSSGSILQSDLILVKSGILDGTGYHTVQLDTPVPLTGSQFAVVVHYNTPGVQYCVPVERRTATNSYYANAESEPGRSYIAPSLNLISWREVSTEEFGYANCCIKAYTKNTSNRAQVTFQTNPSYAQVTVKKDGQIIKAQPGGIYSLEPGTYTYSAEAMDYNTYAERSFTVQETDITSGKKLTITMTQGAAPPQVLQIQQEIIYRLRTAQTVDFSVDLGTKSAAATGIRSVLDEEGNALVLGRDYTFANKTLSIQSSYTDSIVLTSDDYAVLEGPTKVLQVVFNDTDQTTVPISIKFRFAAMSICLTYIQADLEAFQATNATNQTDVLTVIRGAFINPNLEVKYDEPLTVTRASGITAGLISGRLYLEDNTTGEKKYFSVQLPIYPYVCDVTVSDSSGTEVFQIQSPQQLTVTLSGTINGSVQNTNRILIGVYNEKGKMIRFRQIPHSLLQVSGTQFTSAISVQIEPQSTIQVMVWDGMAMHPLSSPVIWQLQ